MNTVGTPLLWGGFAVVVAIMLAIDLLLQGRRGAHAMTMKQAAAWSLVWVTLSLLFNAAFWWYLVQTEGRAVADPQALAFLTGYLIEKSLAVDNVFVWLMLFSYFSVPAALQRRVLVYGVLGAIVLRTIMIFTGSWLISQFDWILYIFGAFLLFTGVKMALAHEDESGIGDKPLVRWLRGHLRMTDTIDNEHFFVRKNGLLYATPLMLVLILVELSDVIFAVDSIPAIFAVTTDPFIVLTSNLFAILGLRAMYFLLAGVAERFSMLKYGLAVILVGDNPASAVYVRNKEKDCAQCGVRCLNHHLPAETTQQELLALVEAMNRREDVDGILVQLPLPEGLDSRAVLEAIRPEKDVDAFHPENVGRLMLGLPRFLPCTPAGVMALLRAYGISPAGKHCVVIGRSNIVGKPMALLLLAEDATVTVCHSRTPDLAEQCRRADILISAVGRRGLITADMVKPGAVVVDVAMNRNEEGKLCGDVDFAAVAEKAAYITPVPGGVGPMTRAMLMENTISASRRRQHKED